MAKAAARSGAVVMLFDLLCITLCPFLFGNQLEEEEKDGYFAFTFLQMYCYNKCSVALPHGALGWSAVCDCVFPDHTHLVFDPNISFFKE